MAPERVKYSIINIACNSACEQLRPFCVFTLLGVGKVSYQAAKIRHEYLHTLFL